MASRSHRNLLPACALPLFMALLPVYAAGADDTDAPCQAPAVPSSESALDVEGVTADLDELEEPVGPDASAAQASEAEKDGAAAAHLSPATALRLEEIVVTARRREELLQETPLSLTALDDDALREAQVQTLEGLQGLVPNLVYHTTGSGQDATPFIRGVGATPASFFDQGVGTYVDGVYLARASGSLLDVVDFQQVEVLRGPQGTLFGKIGSCLAFRHPRYADEVDELDRSSC